MKRIRMSLLILQNAVMGTGGQQIHEAHVMVQQHEGAELRRQQLFHTKCFLLEDILAGGHVHLPHHARPESARPPAVAIKGCRGVAVLLPHVRDNALLRRTLCASLQLFAGTDKSFVNPFFHIAKPPSADFSMLPLHRFLYRTLR